MVADIHLLALAQVHECHNITRLIVIVALVGDPHLDTRDVHTRRHQRQARAPLIVMITEEVGQEKVAVLVILVGRDVKLTGLGSAIAAHGFRLAILLRHEGSCREFAELQFRFDTKQGSATMYQRRTGSHAHITGFDVLDDLVFLTFVSQLQVLAVEVKCRSSII